MDLAKKIQMRLLVVASLFLCSTVAQSKSFWPPCGQTKPYDKLGSTEDGFQYIDGYVIICFKKKCEGITYRRLCQLFPGLFVSKEDFARSTGLPYRSPGLKCQADLCGTRSKREGCVGVDDGDMCCSTVKYFTNTPPGQVYNVYGERCIITAGQFKAVGECGNIGDCQGTCQVEFSTLWFLALNMIKGELGLEPFYVPSHCSCQNTN